MTRLQSLVRAFAPKHRLLAGAEQLADIIYPPESVDVAALKLLDEPCCMRCGFPFEFSVPDSEMDCAACVARPPKYTRARAAMAYDGASQSLILGFKHGGRTHHLDMFAAQMMRAGRGVLNGPEVLVPVPLHPSRLRKRKFNQATLLAKRISKLSDVPTDTNCLVRVKRTQSQGRKSARARRRNVSGAFQVQGDVPRRIVLIDDVMTTGATLDACASALMRAGAERVDALTLSRVVREREIKL